jgi:hypothetical protein
MKPAAHFFAVLAATLVALAAPLRAQLVTYETETQTGYTGSVTTFGASGSGATKGEIFTNVSAVASLTYNFFAGSGNGNVSSATNLTATFGEWNGSAFVGGTTVSFGTITVPASTDVTWVNNLSITGGAFRNFSTTFDFTTLSSPLINATYGYLTSASKNYALMLTNTSGNTNLGLGLNTADIFTFGYKGFAESGEDWVFSQIIVAPGDQQLTPVPEASTVASAAALAMVGALVGFRVRQRRQLVAAPVAA